MSWPAWFACFFAGAFLANTVPHFVHGISGDRFPTPFARPPGRGLSSAPVNMVWSLVNLAAGIALFCAGRVAEGGFPTLAVFFAGIAVLSLPMSVRFQSKHAD